MTRPDIEAIRKRAEAATPGPWNCSEWGTGSIHAGNGEFVAEADSEGNADFITHSREDMRNVLAYVAELEAVARKVAVWNDADYRRCQFCYGEFDYDAEAERGEIRFNHAADCSVIIARQLLSNQASRTVGEE